MLGCTETGKAEPQLARIGERIYSRGVLLKEYTIEDVQLAFYRAVSRLPEGLTLEEKAERVFGRQWRRRAGLKEGEEV